jgi:hypothetical protein
VSDVDSLRRMMEKITASKPGLVVMKVKRGIHTAFLELEPDWKN